MNPICYIVEKEKIEHNIGVLRQRVGARRIYAVLKADGYGLGCQELASVYAACGLDCFAVANVKEAQAVCSAGVPVRELLLMSSAQPEQIPALVDMGVTFTVASRQDADNLAGLPARAHIKVDTGLGRRGFDAEDVERIAQLYAEYPQIQFTGIYTHFADGSSKKMCRRQFERFRNVLTALEKQGIQPGIRHCCNSQAVFHQSGMMLDAVRVGSALLGRIVGESRFGLQRTGICQARIEAVRTLKKGTTVGYGGVFRLPKEMKVATCPIGTHHGFAVSTRNGEQNFVPAFLALLRVIKNRVTGRGIPAARIQGSRCRALGCICTEAVMLDVTGVPCQAGDVAEFDINPMLLHDAPVEFI